MGSGGTGKVWGVGGGVGGGRGSGTRWGFAIGSIVGCGFSGYALPCK